jgi:hypothetical protein
MVNNENELAPDECPYQGLIFVSKVEYLST